MLNFKSHCMKGILFHMLIYSVALASCSTMQKQAASKVPDASAQKDYLTLEEAVKVLKVPGAAAPFMKITGELPALPRSFSPPYRSITPVKLFDNLYCVGTRTVGSYIIDTGEGLVMMDTGIGDEDVSMMVEDMRKLGLDPSSIKVIFISHEHFDHYGGVQYLKKNICPSALVAMSLTGWNMLQNVPSEWAYISKRPEKVDIYLSDGMKIKIGNVVIHSVATPGHSPGCLSFIFPVTDNGEKHMVGMMGGSAVWPTQAETRLYKASIEYFNSFAQSEGCDVGLLFHPREQDYISLRERKPGQPNPLVIGKENFDKVYLEGFRTRYRQMLESGNISPYQAL